MSATAVAAAAAPPAGLPAPAAVRARARRENFPVALRVLPRRLRADLVALYGVVRLIDDVADEAPGDRGALLDWLDDELDRLQSGHPTHALTAAARPAVVAGRLPVDELRTLVAGARAERDGAPIATFDDLLASCAGSAAPVGRAVLHLAGAATPARVVLADRVCAGLQIAEHLQDVAEDRDRGRVYLPAEDLARCGASVADLAVVPALPAVRRTIALEAARARRLLDAAVPLVADLRGRRRGPLRLAVAAFAAGGHAALTGVARVDHDVLSAPPIVPRAALVGALGRILVEARVR